MARIIYGVAGEGFGHSSRAHIIGKRLIDAGHTVMFAASMKSLAYLRQYFGNAVREVFGLSFHYKDGVISPFETVKYNLAQLPEAKKINDELFKNHIEPFNPDLLITDFEPFSAWWAWKRKLPYISIDNEHILTLAKPMHPDANLTTRLNAFIVTKAYFTGAFRYLILSFFKSEVKEESAVIAPPVVRPEVLTRKATDGRHIVLYTTTASNEIELLEVLGKFPSQPFHIYGYDKDQQHGNAILKKRSTEGFLDDLASCRGVIASAGFSLISECMYFRKRMLMLPLAGQYEQIINAYYVQKLGLGISSPALNAAAVKRFLSTLDKPISDNGQILWPDNKKFFEILQDTLNELEHPIQI
jgi:uncharacterized protein (TIGR00661 family)